jgi:hypothetical protein
VLAGFPVLPLSTTPAIPFTHGLTVPLRIAIEAAELPARPFALSLLRGFRGDFENLRISREQTGISRGHLTVFSPIPDCHGIPMLSTIWQKDYDAAPASY